MFAMRERLGSRRNFADTMWTSVDKKLKRGGESLTTSATTSLPHSLSRLVSRGYDPVTKCRNCQLASSVSPGTSQVPALHPELEDVTRGKFIRVGILGLLLATCGWQLWPEVRSHWPRAVGADELLIPVCRDGLCGWIDPDGNERIPLKWHSIRKFDSCGYAPVLFKYVSPAESDVWSWGLDERWGFINRQGQVVIPPEWEWVNDFDQDGYALVQRDGKGGVIDRQGRVVVEPQWEGNFDYWFAESDRISHGGRWDWMERNAPDLTETEEERTARLMSQLWPVERNGKYGYQDWQDEMVLEPIWDKAEYFGQGDLARVQRDGKWGWINHQGIVLIDPQWDEAEEFDPKGLALVRIGDDSAGKSGWIDCRGEIVIAPQYDTANRFDVMDMAKVQLGGEWGWRDNGNGAQNRVRIGGKWGWIDRQGQTVGELQWDEADDFGMDGWTRDTRDGKSGWFDSSGSMSSDPKWDNQWNVESAGRRDGWVRVKRGTLWGWVDRQGRVVIEPQWEQTTDFGADGWAQVKRRDKWGWIDRQGRVVIEPQWEQATDFGADGWAQVKHSGQWGWIDRKGQVVIEPLWESCTSFASDGWAQAERGGQWGWIDRQGQVVIEPRWAETEEFDAAGLASVSTQANLSWEHTWSRRNRGFGYTERKREFKDAFDRSYLVVPSQMGGVWGLINRQGQVVIEPKWNHCGTPYRHRDRFFYVVSAHRSSSLKMVLDRLPGWVPRLHMEGDHHESACYDSTGRMIWSSHDRFHRRLIAGACTTMLVLYGLMALISLRRTSTARRLDSTQIVIPKES